MLGVIEDICKDISIRFFGKNCLTSRQFDKFRKNGRIFQKSSENTIKTYYMQIELFKIDLLTKAICRTTICVILGTKRYKMAAWSGVVN